jgi:hypothetical protein
MDKTANRIFTSVIQLSEWIRREQHRGWDPYDGTTAAVFKNGSRHTITKTFMRQFNLYSPVNFRPFFRIQKEISTKGCALFSRSYLHLYRLTGDLSYLNEAKKFLDILAEKKINTNGIGWSDYFDYEYDHPSSPDIAVTSEAIKSFSMAYGFFKDTNYLKIAKSAIDFIISDLYVESPKKSYIRYLPQEEKRIVFNASGLTLEALSMFLNHEYSDDLVIIGNNITEFLNSNQKTDGYWAYSYYPKNKFYYKQIDYHQGFILDGLFSFVPYLENRLKDKTMGCIRRGMEFYMKKQFIKNGSSFYRYPIRYPIDIHNQAQGIITFSMVDTFDSEYLSFAKNIAFWTIDNMQDSTGYFYSHKFPFLKNKIPYMRWSQAWMLLALVTLLEQLNKKKSMVKQ